MLQMNELEKARFWSKVDVREDDECWNWLACTNGVGYGIFATKQNGRLAHRIAYGLLVGSTDGFLACHTCDNRLCVNPKHIFLGKHKDNTQDCIRKGRFAVGSRAGGARLTEIDVRNIRELYVPRKFGRFRIARKLGLPIPAVDGVIQGNWAWLK